MSVKGYYDKLRKEYLKNPNVCPFCGSTNITDEHAEFDGNSASRPVACEECNKEWVEELTLTHVIFNDETV
jgi:transposase-like protein